jgi:hypothetical protein
VLVDPRTRTGTPVELRCRWGGDQGVASIGDIDAKDELITPHDPARGMNDVGVADRITLGVERTLDHEWTAMFALDDAGPALMGSEAKAQHGLPPDIGRG